MAETANQALRRRGSNEDDPPNLNEDPLRRSSTMFRRHERERREAMEWNKGHIAIGLLVAVVFIAGLGYNVWAPWTRHQHQREALAAAVADVPIAVGQGFSDGGIDTLSRMLDIYFGKKIETTVC